MDYGEEEKSFHALVGVFCNTLFPLLKYSNIS